MHAAAPGSLEAREVDQPGADLVVVPRTVKDAVTRRCRQLSPASRQVLEIAAVIGQRFDLALLQAVGAAAGDALIGSLKELVAAQLVVEETAERFRFRHALTREASTRTCCQPRGARSIAQLRTRSRLQPATSRKGWKHS